MNDRKTLWIPRDLGTRWLAALRSGEYKQGGEKLKHDTPEPSYCCLGVLQQIADGDVERTDGRPDGLPSSTWCRDHNVRSLDSDGLASAEANAWLPSIDMGITGANDGDHENEAYVNKFDEIRPLTFTEIADLLERHMELTDG